MTQMNFTDKIKVAIIANGKYQSKRLTAKLFAILRNVVSGAKKEKANAINPCQRYGIALAAQAFPRRIPPCSAITFGVYMYS